ncbi:MAG TPA: peptidoglycan DD-metalloendopeptidase family protein [Candidatus Saccharimonadales bacterium]
MSITKINIYHVLKVLVAGWLAGSLVLSSIGQPINAESAASLQAQINQLQQKIATSQDHADSLHAQANTLKAKISQIQVEIDATQNRINLTDLKIKKLNHEITETETELEFQRGILAESIKELYKRGNVTTIELLASSHSYSDFISQQEYLSRMKAAIEESAAKVEQLKEQLETEREQQQDLRDELEGQRQILNNQRAEQQAVLTATEGQEAKYQAILTGLKKQQAAAERALSAFIASGNFVNLGPISAGGVIGTVGNTGFSTGPHLHFEIRNPNGTVTNPHPFINSGWQWPAPGSPGLIWQDYGVLSGWYVNGFHPGIDTGYAGGSVVAMAAGTIIARGCSQDFLGTPAYGYMVMIDHSNGFKSLYAHMLPPAGGAYSHCSGSYGF